jgi:hypothetical protein
MSRRFAFLTLLVCCSAVTSIHAAARLVTFQITHQGKVILVATHTDNGLIANAEVWKNLRTVNFNAEKDVKVPSNDSLEWKLDGDVLIEAKHSGNLMAKANVKDLLLARPVAGGIEWTLKPGEMSRLADVTEIITRTGNNTGPAGAPVVAEAPRNELPRWFWIMGGIVIVLIIILGSKLLKEAQSNR